MKRSPFFYVGDKYKLMPQLCKLFPKNILRFIEPFVGGGSVFLNADSKIFLANDSNTYVIDLHKHFQKIKYKTLIIQIKKYIKKYGFSASFFKKTIPFELKKQYPKTYFAEFNKKSYLKLKEDFNLSKKDMTKLYLLLVYGFNHMIRFNSKGEFNLPVGNVDFNKNVAIALSNYFQFIKKKNITFTCLDFEKFLHSIKFKKRDFVFVDPPYLISSSEYNKKWTEKEERRLLKVLDELNKIGVKFGLTNLLKHKGKTNKILLEWSKKYKVVKLKSNYISFNDNTIKKDSIEIYVHN